MLKNNFKNNSWCYYSLDGFSYADEVTKHFSCTFVAWGAWSFFVNVMTFFLLICAVWGKIWTAFLVLDFSYLKSQSPKSYPCWPDVDQNSGSLETTNYGGCTSTKIVFSPQTTKLIFASSLSESSEFKTNLFLTLSCSRYIVWVEQVMSCYASFSIILQYVFLSDIPTDNFLSRDWLCLSFVCVDLSMVNFSFESELRYFFGSGASNAIVIENTPKTFYPF